jgi:hypothetical protein
MTCQEIGQWITDNVEKPLQEWFARARQQCTEARRWLEERRREIEDWRRTQEARCREQPCQWLCLCCNKWFCWIVDILLRILTIFIQVIEHVIEAICTLIVTVIWLTLSILVQVIKWIVLSVVCLLQALCPILVLIGAVALLAALLGIVALSVPALAPAAIPVIPTAIVIAALALATARLLCEMSRCRIPGAIGWALKWAIVIGAVITLVFLSPPSALVVVVYGGLVAALAVLLEKVPCTLPSMLGLP